MTVLPKMRPQQLLAMGLLALGLAPGLQFVREARAESARSDAAAAAMAQGTEAFQRGDYEQAAASWGGAADFYGETGALRQELLAARRLAAAQQALGAYQSSAQRLLELLPRARQVGDAREVAAMLGAVGNAYVALGDPELAGRYLEEAVATARAAQAPVLVARTLNNLANHHALEGRYAEALSAHDESAKLAEEAGENILVMRVRLNAGRAALDSGDVSEARSRLAEARALIAFLPNGHDAAALLTTLGRSEQRLARRLDGEDEARTLLLRAHGAFTQAAQIAESLGDARAAAYAWGYLGELYEQEGRSDDALQSTLRAQFAAQQGSAPESLYRWQWQLGRLHRAAGRNSQAIAAYRNAVQVLASIRYEMATGYGHRGASFRDQVEPIHFQFVDLLLRSARTTSDPRLREGYLVEAREAVEALKLAELRDYFRDECVDAAQAKVRSLDDISANAVIVYPIALEDRLELLVRLPHGLRSFAAPVGSAELQREIRGFRRQLEKRITHDYLASSKRLYDWLVRPFESELRDLEIDALVFVPGGALRTVPMAALHDGKDFLISRYPVATTPGLKVTDPRPLDRAKLKLLLAGVSEPVQGFAPLEHVPAELEAIRALYEGDVLLDQAFSLEAMRGMLRSEKFNVIHVASHGEFRGSSQNSFLLTYYGKLTLDRLGEYVGLLRFREDPLELLTMSACETAYGDDRAALGLAGIAIRAGARSALGTLWKVDDEAAALLIGDFYRELRNASVSRAVALQRAQIKMLEDLRYRHPSYWSAFLLISSWL